MDKDIKEDKELPFNELSVLYNKVLKGLKNKVVILETGEDDDLEVEDDDDLWLDNIEVLYSIILGNLY